MLLLLDSGYGERCPDRWEGLRTYREWRRVVVVMMCAGGVLFRISLGLVGTVESMCLDKGGETGYLV
jgi:hypothetical protein